MKFTAAKNRARHLLRPNLALMFFGNGGEKMVFFLKWGLSKSKSLLVCRLQNSTERGN